MNSNSQTTISGRLVDASEFNRLSTESELVTIDLKLASGARSARSFRPAYDSYFAKTFLLYTGPNGEIDALRGLNTDTALALINDPKREAVVTFKKKSI